MPQLTTAFCPACGEESLLHIGEYEPKPNEDISEENRFRYIQWKCTNCGEDPVQFQGAHEDIEGPCWHCREWTSVEEGAGVFVDELPDDEEPSPGTVAWAMLLVDATGAPVRLADEERLVCPDCLSKEPVPDAP